MVKGLGHVRLLVLVQVYTGSDKVRCVMLVSRTPGEDDTAAAISAWPVVIRQGGAEPQDLCSSTSGP